MKPRPWKTVNIPKKQQFEFFVLKTIALLLWVLCLSREQDSIWETGQKQQGAGGSAVVTAIMVQ